MAIYKPSNFSPNLSEIDLEKENIFTCQANTNGEVVKASKLTILSGDGQEEIYPEQNGRYVFPKILSVPVQNKETVSIPERVTENLVSNSALKNGNDYQWGIRLYTNTPRFNGPDPITPTVHPSTPVCQGYIVGSTKTVIWCKILRDEGFEKRVQSVLLSSSYGSSSASKTQFINSLSSTFSAYSDAIVKQIQDLAKLIVDGLINKVDAIGEISKITDSLRKEITDQIVYDRFIQFETKIDNKYSGIIVGAKKEKDIELPPIGSDYKQRRKINWVIDELGLDSDIIKIELEDELEFDYPDGTAFSIYQCDNQHTISSFFVDPNSNINVADFIMIYASAHDAYLAAVNNEMPDPTTWVVTKGRQLLGPTKVVGYSSDTGEVRIMDEFPYAPLDGMVYRIFSYDPTIPKFTERIDSIVGYSVPAGTTCYLETPLTSTSTTKDVYLDPQKTQRFGVIRLNGENGVGYEASETSTSEEISTVTIGETNYYLKTPTSMLKKVRIGEWMYYDFFLTKKFDRIGIPYTVNNLNYSTLSSGGYIKTPLEGYAHGGTKFYYDEKLSSKAGTLSSDQSIQYYVVNAIYSVMTLNEKRYYIRTPLSGYAQEGTEVYSDKTLTTYSTTLTQDSVLLNYIVKNESVAQISDTSYSGVFNNKYCARPLTAHSEYTLPDGSKGGILDDTVAYLKVSGGQIQSSLPPLPQFSKINEDTGAVLVGTEEMYTPLLGAYGYCQRNSKSYITVSSAGEYVTNEEISLADIIGAKIRCRNVNGQDGYYFATENGLNVSVDAPQSGYIKYGLPYYYDTECERLAGVVGHYFQIESKASNKFKVSFLTGSKRYYTQLSAYISSSNKGQSFKLLPGSLMLYEDPNLLEPWGAYDYTVDKYLNPNYTANYFILFSNPSVSYVEFTGQGAPVGGPFYIATPPSKLLPIESSLLAYSDVELNTLVGQIGVLNDEFTALRGSNWTYQKNKTVYYLDINADNFYNSLVSVVPLEGAMYEYGTNNIIGYYNDYYSEMREVTYSGYSSSSSIRLWHYTSGGSIYSILNSFPIYYSSRQHNNKDLYTDVSCSASSKYSNVPTNLFTKDDLSLETIRADGLQWYYGFINNTQIFFNNSSLESPTVYATFRTQDGTILYTSTSLSSIYGILSSQPIYYSDDNLYSVIIDGIQYYLSASSSGTTTEKVAVQKKSQQYGLVYCTTSSSNTGLFYVPSASIVTENKITSSVDTGYYNKQVLGGVPIDNQNYKILSNRWDEGNRRLFIQPNINIKSDDTNPPEIVFNQNNVRGYVAIVKPPVKYIASSNKYQDVTFDILDNSQWMLNNESIYLNDGSVPLDINGHVQPQTDYSVYTDFMDGEPSSLFYARRYPDLVIQARNNYAAQHGQYSNYESIVDGAEYDYRDIEFSANYDFPDKQKIKYYYYTLYTGDGEVIAQQSDTYSSVVNWVFRGLENTDYIVELNVIDEYGAKFTQRNFFTIKYQVEQSGSITPLTLEFDCHENAIKINAVTISFAGQKTSCRLNPASNVNILLNDVQFIQKEDELLDISSSYEHNYGTYVFEYVNEGWKLTSSAITSTPVTGIWPTTLSDWGITIVDGEQVVDGVSQIIIEHPTPLQSQNIRKEGAATYADTDYFEYWENVNGTYINRKIPTVINYNINADGENLFFTDDYSILSQFRFTKEFIQSIPSGGERKFLTLGGDAGLYEFYLTDVDAYYYNISSDKYVKNEERGQIRVYKDGQLVPDLTVSLKNLIQDSEFLPDQNLRFTLQAQEQFGFLTTDEFINVISRRASLPFTSNYYVIKDDVFYNGKIYLKGVYQYSNFDFIKDNSHFFAYIENALQLPTGVTPEDILVPQSCINDDDFIWADKNETDEPIIWVDESNKKNNADLYNYFEDYWFVLFGKTHTSEGDSDILYELFYQKGRVLE